MRKIATALAMGCVWATTALAQAPAAAPPAALPPRGDVTVPDYARADAWLCRPGVDDGTCSKGLDAIAVDAAGGRTPVPYTAARDAPIDCFYVYPTVSNDPTLYSDMVPGAEERRTTQNQAARLGSVCRLFVPLYHQLTMTALRAARGAGVAAPAVDFRPPYAGILAAWRSYLARDNQGRGVVLVGHSQGAFLLRRLLAEEIDGKPVQKRLVGAYLAGNVDLTDRTFRTIPACTASGQVGCLTAWSSYAEDDAHPNRFFGSAVTPGTRAICVNPAAPAGGRAVLKTYLPKPAIAPAGDPPFVEAVGQLSAECVGDAQGQVLRIRVEPSPFAPLLKAGLAMPALAAMGWGLHPLDVNLVEGNMLDMIAAQSAAWTKRR